MTQAGHIFPPSLKHWGNSYWDIFLLNYHPFVRPSKFHPSLPLLKRKVENWDQVSTQEVVFFKTKQKQNKQASFIEEP